MEPYVIVLFDAGGVGFGRHCEMGQTSKGKRNGHFILFTADR